MNLKFPKYDWTSEQQAVKQGFALIITMVVGIFGAMFSMIAIILTGPFMPFATCILIVILLGITWLFYHLLHKIKLYDA